jgi:hypothetical protein
VSLLGSLERFGVEVLMYGVDLIVIFLYFELLVGEGVDPSADDAHLVLVQAQVLDAVGVAHDLLHADGQVLQGEGGVFGDVDVQLLQLLEDAFSGKF